MIRLQKHFGSSALGHCNAFGFGGRHFSTAIQSDHCNCEGAELASEALVKAKIVEKLHSIIVVFKLLINAWSAYMMQVQPTMADTMLRRASWFFWLTACGETM